MTRQEIRDVVVGLMFIQDRLVARQAYQLIKELSDDMRTRVRSRTRSVIEEIEKEEP